MSVTIHPYSGETDLKQIKDVVDEQLSEPYSIYTYRYFVRQWPKLCFIARIEGELVGAIVCKLALHRSQQTYRGYIAMLVVNQNQRRKGIGTMLVKKVMHEMKKYRADEIVLETEVENTSAIALYRRLGFLCEKRLGEYYLNGGDAFRLKLRLFVEPNEDEDEDGGELDNIEGKSI